MFALELSKLFSIFISRMTCKVTKEFRSDLTLVRLNKPFILFCIYIVIAEVKGTAKMGLMGTDTTR
jgi:hypothetical protein